MTNDRMKSKRAAGFVVCRLLFVVFFLLSCSARAPENFIARVGDEYLTRELAADITGTAYDSLDHTQRSRLVEAWTERKLFELEGARLKLDHDSRMREKLLALTAELYRAELLAREPAGTVADSTIEQYYETHRNEFLRPADSYLFDLYWSLERADLISFAAELGRGDSSRLASGTVSSVGRWLAEKRELESDLAREVEQLQPGECTNPHAQEDGFRMLRLVVAYPAGTVVDLGAVRGEIQSRLLFEQSRARQDSLIAGLKRRWPVEVRFGP